MDAGAYSYIVKPFAPEDLTRQVKDILDQFAE
jgi:DNA-binding response OmpR family regulator